MGKPVTPPRLLPARQRTLRSRARRCFRALAEMRGAISLHTSCCCSALTVDYPKSRSKIPRSKGLPCFWPSPAEDRAAPLLHGEEDASCCERMQGMSPGAGFHTPPWVREVHRHSREGKGLVPSN